MIQKLPKHNVHLSEHRESWKATRCGQAWIPFTFLTLVWLPLLITSRAVRANLTSACTYVTALWPGGINYHRPLMLRLKLIFSTAQLCPNRSATVTPVRSAEKHPNCGRFSLKMLIQIIKSKIALTIIKSAHWVDFLTLRPTLICKTIEL